MKTRCYQWQQQVSEFFYGLRRMVALGLQLMKYRSTYTTSHLSLPSHLTYTVVTFNTPWHPDASGHFQWHSAFGW